MPADAGSRSVVAVALLAFVVYAASFFRGFGRLFFLLVCAGIAVQSGLVLLVARLAHARRHEAALDLIARRGGRVLARPAAHPDRILELSFAGLPLAEADLESLSGLRHLERLDLADTAIGDAALEHISAIRSLRELDLAGTRVTDLGLLHLETMPWLKRVGLGGTEVSLDGLERLAYVQPGIQIEHPAVDGGGEW